MIHKRLCFPTKSTSAYAHFTYRSLYRASPLELLRPSGRGERHEKQKALARENRPSSLGVAGQIGSTESDANHVQRGISCIFGSCVVNTDVYFYFFFVQCQRDSNCLPSSLLLPVAGLTHPLFGEAARTLYDKKSNAGDYGVLFLSLPSYVFA